MGEAVIVMTPSQLDELVRKAVREELEKTGVHEREILTCKEAAEMVGLHPYTLARFAKREKFGRRLGKEWRFTRTELTAWMARRRA